MPDRPNLHLLTVRLDRLFDVVEGTRHRNPETYFGFQYGQLRACGVAAPGSLALHTGAILTVCLTKKDDWRTLVGWCNRSTGKIGVASDTGALSAMVIGGFGTVFVPFLLAGAALPAWLWLGVVVMPAITLISFRQARFLRQVHAELARVRSGPAPIV